MYQNIPTKCLTGVVRISYCHLTEPYSHNGGEPKYSATLLIPKSDTATKADIDQAMRSAADHGVSSCWNGTRPAAYKNALIYDGDGVRQSGEPFGEECRGHWVLTASTKTKPEVVHISNVRSELAPSDIYSGMYARVTINFFPYNSNGNKGIGCGLGNVMKVDDGEPLGGRSSAASDFADLENSTAAPQTGYQAPSQPAYVTQQPYTAPQSQQPYTAPQQAPQYGNIDPITGAPITGIYGL